MKRIYQILNIALLSGLIWSCSDEDTNPRIPSSDSETGANSITLTQPVSGGVAMLSEATASNVWETFIWESASNVNTGAPYYIQIDNQTGDFSKPAQLGPFTTETTIVEVSEGMLNDALIFLGYYTKETVNAQARIYQEITPGIVYYSVPITFTVIGYGGEDPSAIPTLWAVGAGLPTAGWGWKTPVILEDTNKEGIYKTATPVQFTSEGDANFRFFAQTNFDPISYNYPYYEAEGYTIDTKLENANDDSSNFKFVGESGEYTIVIDENAKTISLLAGPSPGTNIVPVPPVFPVLYSPGSYQGWKPENSYELFSSNNDGQYSGYVNFPDANTEFKFTDEPNWDAGIYGFESEGVLVFPGNEAGNITTSIQGSALVTVDTNALTYTIEPASWTASDDSWGVIGDATPTGWDSDTDMVFNGANGLLEVTLDLIGGGSIKFRSNDDWPGNYGDNGFDGMLEVDGANILIPETGTYKITLDLRDPNRATYKIVVQ